MLRFFLSLSCPSIYIVSYICTFLATGTLSFRPRILVVWDFCPLTTLYPLCYATPIVLLSPPQRSFLCVPGKRFLNMVIVYFLKSWQVKKKEYTRQGQNKMERINTYPLSESLPVSRCKYDGNVRFVKVIYNQIFESYFPIF